MSEEAKEGYLYRFRIGQFDCISVSDGTYDYTPSTLFKDLSEDEVIQYLKDYPLVSGKVRSPYTFLFVDTGEHKVLADMGAGKLGPDTGNLTSNLKAAGIEPGEIDTIIITHAHPDHVGGTLDDFGDPKYPNANYFIMKEEWEFWFSDEAYQKVAEHYSAILQPEVFMKVARGQLGPVKDRMKLLTGNSEIVPGVHVHAAPGHTPGHMAVSFSSLGEELFFIGDAIVFPFMIEHPEVVPVFDIIPDMADQTRRKLCNQLTEKDAWVLAQHFPPFPSLGHIQKSGKVWKWKPLKKD